MHTGPPTGPPHPAHQQQMGGGYGVSGMPPPPPGSSYPPGGLSGHSQMPPHHSHQQQRQQQLVSSLRFLDFQLLITIIHATSHYNSRRTTFTTTNNHQGATVGVEVVRTSSNINKGARVAERGKGNSREGITSKRAKPTPVRGAGPVIINPLYRQTTTENY